MNWLRNVISAFIWKNISYNIDLQVTKMLSGQAQETSQRLYKFMEENDDFQRAAIKSRAKEFELQERLVIATEKLAGISIDAKY